MKREDEILSLVESIRESSPEVGLKEAIDIAKLVIVNDILNLIIEECLDD